MRTIHFAVIQQCASHQDAVPCHQRHTAITQVLMHGVTDAQLRLLLQRELTNTVQLVVSKGSSHSPAPSFFSSSTWWADRTRLMVFTPCGRGYVTGTRCYAEGHATMHVQRHALQVWKCHEWNE